jgi:periplasmic divalent cation tolerance protein
MTLQGLVNLGVRGLESTQRRVQMDEPQQRTEDELVLMYVPVPSEEVAVTLGKHLVATRLVACVNIVGPMRSIYEWNGTLEDQVEWFLLAKTRADRAKMAMTEVLAHHPYECPAIDILAVRDAPRAFRDWVFSQTVTPEPAV